MPYQDQNIYLVGMPGSGKTTLARSLADELERKFVDLDEVIQLVEEKTINEIFTEFGEDRFREMEARYLRSCSSQVDTMVMATGGGTPCYHDNMDFINKQGISIYLEVPEEILIERLLKGPQNRPLLRGKSETELLSYLGDLLAKRKPYYRRATLVISGIEMNARQILGSLAGI